MNRWSQLGNKQPTDNRHYTLKISGFLRFVVNLEKMNYTISLFVSECTIRVGSAVHSTRLFLYTKQHVGNQFLSLTCLRYTCNLPRFVKMEGLCFITSAAHL